MTSPISSTSGTNTDTQTQDPSTPASSNNALGSESVFLQLLVSQIKNQDPLNPMDSMNFVTQLAQFSQLEAILGMRSDLKAAEGLGAGTATDTSGQNGTSGTGDSGTSGTSGTQN